MDQDAANPQAKTTNDLLREGIAAAQSGQREVARDLLMRVVEQDKENAQAWLWMSGVVGSLEDREICLENVLTLNPDHAAARRGLEQVHRQKESQTRPPVGVPPPARSVPESAVTRRARSPVSPAGAVLREDFDARYFWLEPEPSLPPSPSSPIPSTTQEDFVGRRPPEEPDLPPSPAVDPFTGDYLCPYCAARTEPDDHNCDACGGDLWIRFRRREKRSTSLWFMLAFQFFSAFASGTAPILLIFSAGMMAVGLTDALSLSDPLALVDASQGLPSLADVVSAGLAAVPGYVLLLSALPCLFSLSLFVGLYLRWRPVYYVLLVDASCWLLAAVASMILGQGIISGVTGVVLAVAKLLLVFQLEDDFAWKGRRILLRLDRGLSRGADFLARGSFYAKRRMWAMAAIHLRRAVGSLPGRLDCHTALAIAYIRLEYYDRAARALAEASRISPGDTRVEELRGVLDKLRSGASSL